ncbi:hypothetical protein GCM10023093_32010 [Nemorincola caseinilytica]|uniref:Bacteriophage Mx8 p63 C-terminal domain-containing protein n=1 Tax=Nemorincola caseinilytica TaxID=2054315 RepID=A0ABP8NTH4_9BACT
MKKNDRDELKNLIITETEKLTPQQVQEQIFLGTEALTPEQHKERNRKKDEEIIHLTGGGTTSRKQIKDVVASIRQPYKPHFGYKSTSYYRDIYRVKGWPEEEHKVFVKRREVALITKRLIYSRFTPDVLRYLEKENPYIAYCLRKFKNFQFLNKEGQDILDDFINDFSMMIIGYSDWERFEFDYCAKYGIAYQTKIFQ